MNVARKLECIVESGGTTKKRDQKKMKRAAGVVEIHLRRSLSAANDQLHTTRVGTEAGWCANYYIVVFFLFSPLRVMMSASVCIPFINLRHTHRHTAHSSSGVRTSQSRWKRNFPNIFFFCFLWFLSLSSFLLLWLFRLQVCVWVRSFVRCGKRLWTSFIHAAAAVMNNGVHWGRCLLFRARLQLRRGANETHIRIELKQFQ